MTDKDNLPYVKKEVDVGCLVRDFRDGINDLEPFTTQCQHNHETMVCYWRGQSRDQRKWSKDNKGKVFPYDGSSDIRVPFIERYVRNHVAKFMGMFRRMRIIAHPISSDRPDMRKASHASSFLKFIISQIKEFYSEAELAANYYFRYGLCVTYQGWEQMEQRIKKLYTQDDMPDEMAMVVLDEAQEKLAIEMVGQVFPNLPQKSIKRAIREMRETGRAEVDEVVKVKNRACIRSLSPVDEIFFPVGTTDIQKAPYIWMVQSITPEEVIQKQSSGEWDSEFCDELLKQIDVDILDAAGQKEIKSKQSGTVNSETNRSNGLIQVVYVWQRMIDSDGNVGVYRTVVHPLVGDKYGTQELSEYEHGQYPFIATKRELWSPRLYDTRGYPEVGYGFQVNYKGLLDSAFNAESLTTMKPIQRRIMGIEAGGDIEIAPLSMIDVMTMDQYKPFDIASEPSLNVKMREDIKAISDAYFGEPDGESIDKTADALVQNEIDKLVGHFEQALNQIYLLYKQYGDKSTWFKVSGRAEAIEYRNDPNDIYDFKVAIDAGQGDTEVMEAKMRMMTEIVRMNTDGTLDVNELSVILAEAIDPLITDRIAKSPKAAQQESISQEQDAIAKIMAGVGVDVPEEQFNEIRYRTYMEWFMRPDVQERLQKDAVVAQMAEVRAKQWEQQAQQYTQNAQIGRLGAQSIGATRE